MGRFSSKVSCTEDTSENSDADSESEEKVDLPPKFQNFPEAIYSCLENVHHSATSVIHAASIVAFL